MDGLNEVGYNTYAYGVLFECYGIIRIGWGRDGSPTFNPHGAFSLVTKSCNEAATGYISQLVISQTLRTPRVNVRQESRT